MIFSVIIELHLGLNISFVRKIAEYRQDEMFQRELNEYLSLIQYDEFKIYEELVSKCGFKN